MKKKYLFIILPLIISLTASSQEILVKNLPKYDRKKVHFGFSVGLNTADFYIRNADDFFMRNDTNDIYSIENKQSAGFHLGPISNFRLGEHFDLRFLINLTFSQRNLNYVVKEIVQDSLVFVSHDMSIASTFIEFPLLIKYKAERINNYRPYIIAGINAKIDMASKKKIKEEEMPKIRLEQPDGYIEIGFGVDFYTTYFKFSPEIKFGVGMLNVAASDGTKYTSSLKYLKSNILMLTFHFE